MCVYVCVCVRERERQRQRQTDRQTDRDRDRERQRQTDRQTDIQGDGGGHARMFVYYFKLLRVGSDVRCSLQRFNRSLQVYIEAGERVIPYFPSVAQRKTEPWPPCCSSLHCISLMPRHCGNVTMDPSDETKLRRLITRL